MYMCYVTCEHIQCTCVTCKIQISSPGSSLSLEGVRVGGGAVGVWSIVSAEEESVE